MIVSPTSTGRIGFRPPNSGIIMLQEICHDLIVFFFFSSNIHHCNTQLSKELRLSLCKNKFINKQTNEKKRMRRNERRNERMKEGRKERMNKRTNEGRRERKKRTNEKNQLMNK